MNSLADIRALRQRVETFAPDTWTATRLLSLFSGALVVADDEVIQEVARTCRHHNIPRQHLYETVLQSYLFLGFPRMLIGAENLHACWPGNETGSVLTAVDNDEGDKWLSDGMALYKKVYGNSDDALKQAVESKAPEVFRWMIIEGYGKVLSRPGFDIVDRELSIVAFLLVENRPRQLYSHIRGASHVGATPEHIRAVTDELRTISPDGYKSACDIITRLKIGA